MTRIRAGSVVANIWGSRQKTVLSTSGQNKQVSITSSLFHFSPNQSQRAKDSLYDFIDVLADSYSPVVAYCETYYFVVLSPPTDDYLGAFQYIDRDYYMIQTLKNLEMEGYTGNG